MRITKQMKRELLTQLGSMRAYINVMRARRVSQVLVREQAIQRGIDYMSKLREDSSYAGYLNKRTQEDNKLGIELNQEWYHAECVRFMVMFTESKSIKKIAYNVSREVYSMVSSEDIASMVTMKLWEKPSLVTDIGSFWSTCKRIANDSIRTEVRRYRQFAVSSIDGIVRNDKKFLFTDDVAGIRAIDFRNDMKALLDETEYNVFYLFYVKDKAMLEVDNVIGQRCDRILKRVKEKVLGYYNKGLSNLNLPVYVEEKKAKNAFVNVTENMQAWANSKIVEKSKFSVNYRVSRTTHKISRKRDSIQWLPMQ